MTAGRIRLLAAMLALLAALLLAWAIFEARRQRRAVEDTLEVQAGVLARSLGPGLVAASHAARELDEIVLWKLLDNARLFAELGVPDEGNRGRLEELAEDNGLSSVVYFDAGGAIVATLGESVGDSRAGDLAELFRREAEEIVLGAAEETNEEHIGAAVATAGGGAVWTQIHTSSALAFARRLGVENLLGSLVGKGGVLYLSYREAPENRVVEASWDEEPLPDPGAGERRRMLRGQSVYEVELPIDSPAGSEAWLRVGLDGRPLDEAASAAMRRTLMVSIVLLGFAVAASGFAVVSRLRASEREEAAARLAAAEAAQRRSERLAAAGALTAGLAHEVRSPMNAIGLAAQRLERRLPVGDERRAIAGRIREELKRLEEVLREFLELAAPVSERRERVDLGEIAERVRSLLTEEAETEKVRLRPVSGSGSASVDANAIRRALINLVRNAIQASPENGEVAVEVEMRQDTVGLTVRDEGPGLAPEMAERAFEAFVTGRAEGTGLGLAMVRRVAEEHGGTARLTNLPGGGAEACLELPTAESVEP